MKSLARLLSFLVLILTCISATRQAKQQVYLRILDNKGQLVRGTSTARGFERQIEVLGFSGMTSGEQIVQFSMPAGSATATFMTAQGGKDKLSSAVFTTATPGTEKIFVSSELRLEEITVLKVSDKNGVTDVTLQASRIGSTYYQFDRRTGKATVSAKSGYDFTNKQEWTSF